MSENGDSPRGLRLVHADGRISECSVVREPDDRQGVTRWIGVAPKGVVFDEGAGDRVAIDYLPGDAEISLKVRRPNPDGSPHSTGWCSCCG